MSRVAVSVPAWPAAIVALYLVCADSAFPAGPVAADVSGETHLGVPGQTATIKLSDQTCTLSSSGDAGKSFTISLKCGNRVQVLWDMNRMAQEGVSLDEPKFSLTWAGDRDGDGRLDLIMDMSPKYSCSKRVTYLSTLAAPGEIVGVAREPDLECGC